MQRRNKAKDETFKRSPLHLRWLCILWMILFITACDDGTNYAPVVEMSSIEPIPKSGVHKVVAGESMYEIAWRYGMDYRYLAARNRIPSPYHVEPGQMIALRPNASTAFVSKTPKPQQESPVFEKIDAELDKTPLSHLKPVVPAPPEPKPPEKEPNFSMSGWFWPAKGKLLNRFSMSHKGINIAGKAGEPVHAAGNGKVVYCGDGLRGYGNLIILKHNNLYLSAYAHNRKVFVKEGDWVKQGQVIAEMGNTGTDRVMLHFEIRKAGKPIDPLEFYRGKLYS